MEDKVANKRRRLKPEPHPASLDFISSLPDDMPLVIITLFPTKSGVRTTLLSRRWLSLWRCVPLNLTMDSYLRDGDCKRMAAISKILASHPRPARRLDIRMFNTNFNVQAKFDEWFLSPGLDQLEELSFEGGRCLSLPPSVLRLTPMLRCARFISCYFPQIIVVSALLHPQLKQLSLFDIAISKEAMEHLLRGCTTLEYLCLQKIHGFISLHIALTNLRRIDVSCWPRNRTLLGKRSVEPFHDMVIKNAPFLEILLVSDLEGPTKIRVIEGPKLTVLAYSSAKFSEFVIGSIIIQKMIPTSLTQSGRTVKILAIKSIGPNLDQVIGFLRCFPCTEKLLIEIKKDPKVKNVLQYNNLIKCLDLHLTEIDVIDCQGTTSEIKLARFLFLKASVLKVMRFGILWCNNQWCAGHRKRLKLNEKGSAEAEFVFERSSNERRTSLFAD